MKDKKKTRGSWSVPRVRLMGLLCFSILIIAQITLSPPLISIFSSFSSSADLFNLRLSLYSNNHSQSPEHKLSTEKARGEVKRHPHISIQINCDRTTNRYDLCNINGSTVVDPIKTTFYVMGPTRSNKHKIVEKVKPYPRKFDDDVMPKIKDVTLISGSKGPKCKIHHNSPALVFSAGGYTGNFYHDFNDGFIPLFITVNTIFPNHQDFILVLSECANWWVMKYVDLLGTFSKHPIISLKNETKPHCFLSTHVGLISHGFMTINSTLLPNSKTYLHFREAIHNAFGRYMPKQISSPKNLTLRPRLVFVIRKGPIGRVILNQEEAIRVMEEVGFDVIVFEPKKNDSLHESYEFISSCHAMVGVHGAALMHALFLRPGSVFMQIVPIGVKWAADTFFGRLGRGLNMEYMEYHIEAEESSLVEKYGKDSLMVKNPSALQKGGWPIELMNIYLKEQDVKLDLVRFRGYIEEVYKKASKFMHKE